MHLFIKKGMRRTISCIAKGHSKANNKYMHDYIYVDKNQVNLLCIWMQIINMVGQSVSIYLIVDLYA